MSDSEMFRKPGPKPKDCGCKGIRSCRLCVTTIDGSKHDLTPRTIFNYCINCKKAWQMKETSLQQSSDLWHEMSENTASVEREGNSETNTLSLPSHDRNSGDNCVLQSFSGEQGECTFSGKLEMGAYCEGTGGETTSKVACSHNNSSHITDFEGIVIVENFVSQEEEAFLNSVITNTQFVNSQSGRRKQDFGPKVNFKKQKLRTASFSGLPSYSHFLYKRMKTNPHLSYFEPVELCNLEYCHSRGAHIEAHLDDAWLWGERLVTLNLLSDSALTFTLDSDPSLAVRVPLSRRSLIVVSSAARYTWKHSILPEDIGDRRLAMTFRELSKEFSPGGDREREGMELLKLALTFKGCAVGS